MVETCGENMGVRSFFMCMILLHLLCIKKSNCHKNGRREAPDGAYSGVYTQHFSEICVMILGCIFVLMIMNLLAVKRCRRQVKETAKRTEGMMKMYFEQKKNIEQNTGEKRRERTGSAEQKRSRKEPSREQEELFGSVIREMFP